MKTGSALPRVGRQHTQETADIVTLSILPTFSPLVPL